MPVEATALKEDGKTLAKMLDRSSEMLTMTKANSDHDYLYQLKVMPLLLLLICSLIQCMQILTPVEHQGKLTDQVSFSL